MEKNPHSSLLADLEEIPEQTSEKSEVTSVRKNCQKCSRPFEISLPQDVLEAYTNCPYCGSEELVSMREHS
jgi:DNA-directed RNA polymerase subunit RPC12/RpoP